MSLASLTVLPEADKILGREPMYQINQLKPVARFTADPTVFAVRADAPWKTLADFIADAKKNPGKFTYGSSGNYGTMHMPMEMFAGAAGLKLVHVPYTGAGPAIVALLGGQVDAVATGPATIVQHVKSGKIRALAHWGDVRLVTLPDVPSLKESGTDVQYAQWSGLFVPAATPDAIVARLREAAKAAANDPRVKEVLLTAGSPIQYMDAPEFQKYVDADAAKMAGVVKRVGKVE
jgi:tripartite-type tricarboxylate transporter receptor subunit TctC